jgi:hemimethylated DNA binding protein
MISLLASGSSSVRGFVRNIGTRRTIITKTSSNHDNTAHKRITLMLYRQLIRWCDDMNEDIPLTQLVPPVHIQPPQINSDSIRLLSRDDPKSPVSSRFFPPTALIKENGITVSVPSSTDAKQLIRGVFRMNARTTNEGEKKEQLSLAFDWIKSANGLTEKLVEMKLTRRNNENRDGVHFRIGQVVKHNIAGWRGVILGWNRTTDSDGKNKQSTPPKATSLTKKSYQSMNPDDEIAYDVALDWGDATLMGSGHPTGLKHVYQSDLTLIDDPDLMRIRSSTDHFERFDPESQCFVPGDVLTYVYPNDTLECWSTYTNPSDQAAQNVILGVQRMAEYLQRIILGYTSAPESRDLTLLSTYLDRLTKLTKCDVVPTKDRFRVQNGKNLQNGVTVQNMLKWELQKFVELAVDVEDILFTRRKALDTDRSIKFSLGEYVQHKKYGFRGIVVAWDPEPAYDITHWDGLQHIENPEQYPFYHVIPDRGDSMTAFGGERPWRYVCEDNLELCPSEIRDLDVDLEPAWISDATTGIYRPPDELILRHGNQLEDDGLTEKCLQEIKVRFCFAHVGMVWSDGNVIITLYFSNIFSSFFLSFFLNQDRHKFNLIIHP